MKKLTLGLCLVSTTAALAHDIEYRVCTGDTLSTIAKKFHVSGKSILHANDLTSDHHMRAGHYLLIPGVEGKQAHLAGQKVGRTPSYVVRNGDQDWSLAMKHGMSVHKLHLANPGVDWDHLKIGLRITIPGAGSLVAKAARTHEHTADSKTHQVAAHNSAMHLASTHGVHMKAHWHTVEQGENDWIIAHKAGIKLPLLKALNPHLDVASIHVGQKIRVPGSAISRLALRVPRIHSTHVAISGDNVTIRTEPGLGAESVCTVDQGLHASVVDRDGNWYQLKFPKGTVGWVRGDLLKPVHAIEEVAQTEHRHHHEIVVVHHHEHSYVAASHPAHHVEAPVHHHAYVAKAAAHHHSKPAEHMASSDYTALDTDAGEAEGVLRQARGMRGTRYRWGAASRSATDCSGFTSQVFRANGIHLPRISSDQARVGSKVEYRDLKPGDLVFFHTYRGRRVTHVGIYEGNHKFIHASSGHGRGVTESSLEEPYYSHHLVEARRVLHHRGGSHTHVSHSTEVAEKPADTMAEAEKKLAAPIAAPTSSQSKSSL